MLREPTIAFIRTVDVQIIPAVTGQAPMANYPEHTVALRISLHRHEAEFRSEVHPPVSRGERLLALRPQELHALSRRLQQIASDVLQATSDQT